MKLFGLLLLLVALGGAHEPALGRDTMVGIIYSIKQGRAGKVKGEDLRITFLAVEEDSRCPKGAECVREGNARVRLMARNSKGACAEFVMNTNGPPSEYEFGKYKITLAGLFPYPVAGEQPRDYIVAFTIAKAKK